MLKMLKYEFLNILRSKWLAINFLSFAALSWAAGRVTADPQRTMSAIASFCVIFVPLIATLFSTLYWYASERFTHLMLTQPLPRTHLFWARFIALAFLLTASTMAGLDLGAFASQAWTAQKLGVMNLEIVALTTVFIAVSLLICVLSPDRMRGIGIAFGLWLYLVLLHDALILLCLTALRDYPLDIAGGLIAALNPIGLARVVLLMANDSALLLGHTGALVREIMTSVTGYVLAASLTVLWVAAPTWLARRAFLRGDF